MYIQVVTNNRLSEFVKYSALDIGISYKVIQDFVPSEFIPQSILSKTGPISS